jgi:hypothetical protein
MDLCLHQYQEDANYKEFSHLQAEPSSPQCSTNDLRKQVHILAEPLSKYNYPCNVSFIQDYWCTCTFSLMCVCRIQGMVE